MSTVGKRKRAKKACIPCHQRKRKCDASYPCGMCTTYEYVCRYDDDDGDGASTDAQAQPLSKRASLGGRNTANTATAANRSRSPGGRTRARDAQEANSSSSSTKSPAVVAGASAASTPAGIFDEQKFRYAGAAAAMAFPHVLGAALGSDSRPDMHSFAYNFGIRSEEVSNSHGSLADLISEEDLGLYSGVYFEAIAPLFDFIDRGTYARRCKDYFHGSSSMAVAFAAVAAGVASLGSFLSSTRHPRESDLVQYAKAILDDPASTRMLGIDHIVAWGARVLYLRATTRPNNAWIASCTAMHLCEAIGLHDDESIKKMASVTGPGHDADRLRRIFWITWAGHSVLSYEYDRSTVRFGAMTCQTIALAPGTVSDQFVQLAQILPSSNSPFHLECQPPTPREELSERLKALDKIQCTHPFLLVTKADLAFCFYRRIYQLKLGISEETNQLVINSGNAAVEAAEQLAGQGRLFWNVIGSVFHYVCVLLAIDTPAASMNIASAFKGLENVVKAADTELTRRALSMARYLLNLSAARKRKELARLEAVEASQTLGAPPDLASATDLSDMTWAADWDQFLVEPFLSILGPDVQF